LSTLNSRKRKTSPHNDRTATILQGVLRMPATFFRELFFVGAQNFRILIRQSTEFSAVHSECLRYQANFLSWFFRFKIDFLVQTLKLFSPKCFFFSQL
jgi:hypothetical protein